MRDSFATLQRKAALNLKEIREQRAESMAKMQEAQAADFYFTVVCENEAPQKAILKVPGIPDWEIFANGRVLAGKLGVWIVRYSSPWAKRKYSQ